MEAAAPKKSPKKAAKKSTDQKSPAKKEKKSTRFTSPEHTAGATGPKWNRLIGWNISLQVMAVLLALRVCLAELHSKDINDEANTTVRYPPL